MPALDSKLRSQLDSVCQEAREKAEEAARSALVKRAVDRAEPHAHFKPAEKVLRNRLRARGRQTGDVRLANKTQTIDQLAQELAYEYWHRMLFARFLAENHLLMHPDGVAVSLEECEELAKELSVDSSRLSEKSSPTTDNRQLTTFSLAARYASKMLPQVFRTDDVLLEIEFAPEHRIALEKLLASLPRETFLADDSLGWVYQFWQTSRKKAVNESGNKIDSRTISSVTQLFTEDYMVQFLLHNTLGAWWFGRQLSVAGCQLSAKNEEEAGGVVGCQLSVASEEEARRAVAVPGVNWEYLRFVRTDSSQLPVVSSQLSATTDKDVSLSNNRQPTTDNSFRPAAGTFEGWPKSLKDFTLLDPCCGSGHFLVAALNLLVPLRMHEEGMSAREACDAVLRENLFGLELDPRCTQIAAFALAVAAWKWEEVDSCQLSVVGQSSSLTTDNHQLTTALGYRELPPLNIACTGIGPQASEEEWLTLAEQSGRKMNVLSREPILNGLRNLHALFSDAPTLGSLIDPNQLSADLITADYETLKPYLSAALTAEQSDDDAHERAVAAAGMVKAAELLAGEYTLVITNVPYLGRGKQDDTLKQHLQQHYPNSKADLATAFVERCLEFCAKNGTSALVTPQNWLFLTTYTRLRKDLLKHFTWNGAARLGRNAFQDMNWWAATTALVMLSHWQPSAVQAMMGIDVSTDKQQAAKAAMLRGDLPVEIMLIPQSNQLKNPDAAIKLNAVTLETLLGEFASCYQGISTGDNPQFVINFWEHAGGEEFTYLQSAPEIAAAFGGCEYFVRKQILSDSFKYATIRGREAWGKHGLAMSQTGRLRFVRYMGCAFTNTAPVVVAKSESLLSAVWAFAEAGEFENQIREANQKLSIDNGYVTKIPFDLERWQQVAAEKYPDGLPEPESDDPTQWLFHGRPESSTAPLQVAVARLLGYRWPAELSVVGCQLSAEESPTTGNRQLSTAPMRLSRRARELVQRCDELLPLADRDGLVPISSVRGEPPAAERLHELLSVAGCRLSDMKELKTDNGQLTTDSWLRNEFFVQHCKLFHNRPFIWHIWDGRKDGFACLVNYHQLNHKALENLTYSYLQDWITAQAAGAKTGQTGADLRLAAAQALSDKLKLILTGEPPYDIFVRWKPLAEQAIGWHPDLNDGVRMNIRPFMEAGILRKNPNIKWSKDRGKEPERKKAEYPWFWNGKEFTGNRVNDVHLTNAEKQAARDQKV